MITTNVLLILVKRPLVAKILLLTVTTIMLALQIPAVLHLAVLIPLLIVMMTMLVPKTVAILDKVVPITLLSVMIMNPLLRISVINPLVVDILPLNVLLKTLVPFLLLSKV